MNKKTIEIFSISMANYLTQNGFKIVNVRDNLKNPSFKVFMFDDSEELKATMSKFKK